MTMALESSPDGRDLGVVADRKLDTARSRWPDQGVLQEPSCSSQPAQPTNPQPLPTPGGGRAANQREGGAGKAATAAREGSRAPLTLLLLQGQLVLVVAVEVAPEEEGEFGVLLLLLHRHLLELGPVPRHELRQFVDDIPQLLVCEEAAPSDRVGPAAPPPAPARPPWPRSPSGGNGISMAAGQRGAAARPQRPEVPRDARRHAQPRFTAASPWRRPRRGTSTAARPLPLLIPHAVGGNVTGPGRRREAVRGGASRAGGAAEEPLA